MEQVEQPEPRGDEVLVRVAAAGVCGSDLRIVDGRSERRRKLPLTLGHEVAGWVESIGADAAGIEIGEPVAVMMGWGCGWCRWCLIGQEQLCVRGVEAGSTVDGGFAEYLLVPHRRNLVSLQGLDPVQWAPLGCAGLSAYAAVKRARWHVVGGSAMVVIGAGGLGRFAVQIARALTGARVLAVDTRQPALARAKQLGADESFLAGPDTAAAIREMTGGSGADAVLDFVGTDETLALGASILGTRGILILLGLGGGSFPYGFYSLPPEVDVTTVYAGSVSDLTELVRLAQAGRITSEVKQYRLDDVNQALNDLRVGLDARAVVVPSLGTRKKLGA